MADVEMTDAPVVNKKKGGDGEEKKRFEVKKVRRNSHIHIRELGPIYNGS